MLTLYSLLILMCIVAISLLIFPVLKPGSFFSSRNLLCSLFVLIFSFAMYSFMGNHTFLKKWLTEGQRHYQLQTEVNELGGFDGMVKQIKHKLQQNPNDAKGWVILGKLYLANEEFVEAEFAFNKAKSLQPNNPEIEHFYELALQKNNENRK